MAFVVTTEDLAFYEKVSPVFDGQKYQIPAPTLCPDCRRQRRMAWRNFTKIYNRKSDMTGAPFISNVSPDKPYKVYTLEEWWSDKWDPLQYGRDFDFNRPFFDQLAELFNAVPRPGMSVSKSENCTYTNHTSESKDCYLLFGSYHNESCAYGHILWFSKNCLDMLYCFRCEQCYQCIDCDGCYNLHYGRESLNCSDSYYLFDCRNCSNCFGCVSLVGKEYCIFNRQYSKEEYEKKLAELLKSAPREIRESFEKLYFAVPKRPFHVKNSENVSGNHIIDSKNAKICFDTLASQDCKYCFTVGKFRDAYDCMYNPSGSEIGYETMAAFGYNLIFCRDIIVHSSNLIYCSECGGTSDCFGCVGLHGKEQYCILNKRYSKEEYLSLLPRIIEHMKKTGEWGEFFPAQLSPFGYNESIANEYMPLSRESAEKSFNWSDYQAPEAKSGKVLPAKEIPQEISGVTDDILGITLECEVTKRPFRLTRQELEFYRVHELPIPKRCPDQRHKERMLLRNPAKLWPRACAKCGKDIETSYSPDRPEKVYCEECYLKGVY